MGWLALTLEADNTHAEALSEALLEAGAISVTLEDASAGTAAERALLTGSDGVSSGCEIIWPRTRVQALVDENANCEAIVAVATRAAGLSAAPGFSCTQLADQDWVRTTQSQFTPLLVGENVWIVPSWHDPPDPSAAVVRLDPGLAFGTGSHPTTRLVLAWLEHALRSQADPTATDGARNSARLGSPRVLDYGCGSGILGIAAIKLGAAAVDAVDVDLQAVQSTVENALRNAVAVRALSTAALPAGDYDIVVANILANPLIVLEPLLAARTRPGGKLALSGILAAQAEEVCAAYAADFRIGVCAEDSGWVLLVGTRRSTLAHASR